MTEAGWYADPEGHGRGRRYWDGASWTEHYEHPAAAQQQAPVQQQQPAAQQELPPAGWKDDPEGGSGLRYWDGSEWTDHYHPPREGSTAEQAVAPSGGFAPTGGSFEPASQGFQPASSTPAGGGSLDETQLDVRGYHGGRPEDAEPATSEPAAEEPADTKPEATPAADEPAEEAPVDYGSEGDTSFCENCGAKIRSSHKFCPACGHQQEGLPG